MGIFRQPLGRSTRLGLGAVAALAASQWLLIGLATWGSFGWWPIALPVLLIGMGCAIGTFWQLTATDRMAAILLVLLGLQLYLPPAEELALTGDAAIYVNEGIFIARTGAMQGIHEPLAALPPQTRTLFAITSTEQFPARPIQSYDGMVYRSYYLADAATATIETSRMPLTTVWFAFVYALAGVRMALYSTPLFAILSLLLLYAIARRIVSWPLALAVSVLMAVSYMQIYFGRISYAELFGQFWTLAGMLAAFDWIERRRPLLLVAALFFWATTWAGRIDALLLLPAITLLLLYAALARDRRTLVAVLLSLPLLVALIVLGTNPAYAGATYEIQAWRWPWFGKALIGLLVLVPVSTGIVWLFGKQIQRLLQRLAPALHTIAFLALALVLLWSTVPNPLRDAAITRNYQEIIWFSSAYLTPLFYWLLLLGVGRLLFGGYDGRTFWLLTTFGGLATVYFYTYTSSHAYPVSLRRLTSDLLPLMSLLVGVALAAPQPTVATSMRQPGITLLLAFRTVWQWGRWLIALVLIGWMAFLSRPLWPIHEGVGTLAALEELHNALPANAVVIFEDQDNDSWVGWLAAPLYSLYGDWSLQLDGDTPDPALWQTALDALHAGGHPIYVVTQQADYPEAFRAEGYRATLERQLSWQSTLIGQTNAPYPPPVWDFLFPLNLYRLEATDAQAEEANAPTAPSEQPTLALASPNGKVRVDFFVDPQASDNQLYYTVTYSNRPIITPSPLALVLAESEAPLRKLTVLDQGSHTVDERYATSFGQSATIRDHYNAVDLHLQEAEAPHRELHLLVRAYDQGLALRYQIPAQPGWAELHLQRDRVDFAFADDALAYYEAGTEGEYQPMRLSSLPTAENGKPSETPLTVVQNSGLFVAVTEAAVVNYPRMLLARLPETRTTLTTVPAPTDDNGSRSPITATLPFATPWRVLLVAERAADLLLGSDLLYNLNPPSQLTDESWIRPGTAMRIMKLTTENALAVVDFAATHGIDYVEFDAGWYGLGYHEEYNPASDATAVVDALDLPQVVAYANGKGIGVWLYVNHVALQQQLDALLPLYQAWGVKGIKLGFVDGRTQAGINFVHEIVAKAAAHQLMIDVHDNYRPSGVSRSYPNLLTQEGVRGNEHFPGATQNTILPFTRLVAGAADTTFAYYADNLNVTRAHQLAAQVIFFSPLRFVLWYDSPVHYKGEPEIDLMGALPTVWDETVVLDGVIGEYITVARRKGEDWFVGTMTNEMARSRTIPLPFLEPNQEYTAQIYRDEAPTAVAIEETRVSATTTIDATLLPSGGQVIWLRPLD